MLLFISSLNQTKRQSVSGTSEPLAFCAHLHLSCNGSHQRWPKPLPSWSLSLGTACSSESRRKTVHSIKFTHQCCFTSTFSKRCPFNWKLHLLQLIITPIYYLCCHDEAGGSRVDGNIPGHQSHILKLFVHLSVLLVWESFDGAGEDYSLLLSKGQCDSVSARGGHKSKPGYSFNQTLHLVNWINSLTKYGRKKRF